jgi:GT2 family glycosyltransferase
MLFDASAPPELVHTLQSLENQTSDRWTLIAVVPSSLQTTFTALLSVSGLRRSSARVHTLAPPETSGSLERFEMAIAGSASDVALIFPGDVWAPGAVADLSNALRWGGAAYADEDRVSIEGHHYQPQLKPRYSPEFLLHSFYTGRPFALSADVVARLPSAAEADSLQFEHDLALRACEVAIDVVHIPQILCHKMDRSAEAQSVVPAAGTGHVRRALQRRGESGTVSHSTHQGLFSIRRSPLPDVTTSIIIPFRDEPRFLRACIESIDATRGERVVELVLVDNASVQPETETLVERLSQRSDTLVLRDPRPFNWAQINNAAVARSSGDILCFLNNDVEAQQPGWLDALCAQACRPEIGAVGARLLYPDRRLQHCGVVIGLGGAAGHVLLGLEEHHPGYLNMAVATRECAAVTGACLVTRRDTFMRMGGFDETLGVDLNDIDYCLRVQTNGMRVLVEPEAELVHHESPSRGTAGDVRDIVHFVNRWSSSIVEGDPFLHPALTRKDSSCALRDVDEVKWWQDWRTSLSEAT